jgi:hypothetical protein
MNTNSSQKTEYLKFLSYAEGKKSTLEGRMATKTGDICFRGTFIVNPSPTSNELYKDLVLHATNQREKTAWALGLSVAGDIRNFIEAHWNEAWEAHNPVMKLRSQFQQPGLFQDVFLTRVGQTSSATGHTVQVSKTLVCSNENMERQIEIFMDYASPQPTWTACSANSGRSIARARTAKRFLKQLAEIRSTEEIIGREFSAALAKSGIVTRVETQAWAKNTWRTGMTEKQEDTSIAFGPACFFRKLKDVWETFVEAKLGKEPLSFVFHRDKDLARLVQDSSSAYLQLWQRDCPYFGREVFCLVRCSDGSRVTDNEKIRDILVRGADALENYNIEFLQNNDAQRVAGRNAAGEVFLLGHKFIRVLKSEATLEKEM